MSVIVGAVWSWPSSQYWRWCRASRLIRSAHRPRGRPTGRATSCRPATTADSRPPTVSPNQLPLYDGLTPLRGNVTDADIDSYFLPENFKPVGATHEEPTGRPGTTIVYDAYGVPHVTGQTRADLAFGAGWVTARDRGLLLQLGRGPARVAVADVPGINAFGLVTSGQSFVPERRDRAAGHRPGAAHHRHLRRQGPGDRSPTCRPRPTASPPTSPAHGDRTSRRRRSTTSSRSPRSSARSSAPAVAPRRRTPSSSRTLQNHLGWCDRARRRGMTRCCSTTPRRRPRSRSAFDYGSLTGGPVTGSAVIDEGSIVSLDPRARPCRAAPPPSDVRPRLGSSPTGGDSSRPRPARRPPRPRADPTGGRAARVPSATYPAAGPVPFKQASNFLVVDPTPLGRPATRSR